MKKIICSLFIPALFCGASSSVQSQTAEPSPVATFDMVASHFLDDPPRHLLYATIPDADTVVVFDTQTLQIVKTIAIGSSPQGMAISADRTKLYVARSGATSIGVINLPALTPGSALPIAQKSYEIAVGLEDRLYVTPSGGTGAVLQINATTGATEGTVPVTTYYDGLVQISPDRQSLFVGDIGISSSRLRRYDVSTSTPMLVQTANDTGANGEDLKLSHNGLYLCYPNGAGNSSSYATDVLDPADLNFIYGNFQVGPYPGPITFSHDDAVAYEVNVGADYAVDFFRASTFAKFASLPLPPTNFDEATAVATSGDDRYLFVSSDVAISVFDLAADTTADVTATIGQPFSYQLAIYLNATSTSVTGLPAGLSFDEASQTISGTPTEDGQFTIVVTATNGTNTVDATLNLTLFPDTRPENISTRANVQTGNDVLIAGFIVIGSNGVRLPAQIVVRALGPSLGVSGQLLEDPKLTLYDSTGAVVASNDNWENGQSDLLAGVGLGLPDPREAGLFASLTPGAYTAIVSSARGATGIGLVEVYEIGGDDLAEAAGAARLANLSTRSKVGTGDDVMIGGLIVGPNDDAKMLLRAIGPSLTGLSADDLLANPQIDLYDSNGTVIAGNDNWKDSQESEIEALGLAPTSDLESAISISLASGAYTAIVSGVDGTSGIGLVEAYNLP